MFQKEIISSFRKIAALGVFSLLCVTAAAQTPARAAPAGLFPALTDKYPHDEGMENDPDVLYIENFEDSLSRIKARYTDVLNGAGMSLVPDVPPGSHGRYSLKITNVGGKNDGGHLFRDLHPGLDGTIYVRYYVKYPGISRTYIHHEGLWIGGYEPATTWPDPRAGFCGLDGRLSIAYEPSAHDSTLGTYLYWSGMKSWNGGTSCYGNDVLHNDPHPHHLTWDQWICVEMKIKLNDPVTASNGELEIWQDGVEVGHWGPGYPNGHWAKDTWVRNPADPPFEGFRWRKDAGLNINYFWIEFFDDASPAGVSHYIQYDHLVIARKYIGPLKNEGEEYKSWNPAGSVVPVLEGQAWPKEVKHPYDRLPARAEQEVRKEVWDLSENPAGLQLRFRTNSPEIRIAYQAMGAVQFPHMPATGVSGVDLYAREAGGKWLWCGGKFSFGDTVTYLFPDLAVGNGRDSTREYTLYLPLYNTIKWITISVNRQSTFEPLPARNDKPIVVYGTSIAQGGCASRPGMAWTAILQRRLDLPLVNLGFSGNGRLEKEVMELVAEVDARLYVLDCLPNLIAPSFAANEVKKRLVAAIQLLQSKRPGIPILLTAHAGYTDEGTNAIRRRHYQDVNGALQETFDSLTTAGTTNIYLLSKREIGMDIDCMVDGTHPNDMGMVRYAEAYDKKIRAILEAAKR